MHRDTIMKVTNKMQLHRLIYFSLSALHVSGDVFAHHQEHLTVFTDLVVFTQVAAGCCLGWVGTELCGLWHASQGRRSRAALLLRSWVRIPPGAWMFVCGECCVLSGRGLCDEPITRPEESYQLWCVVVCDLETSRMRRPWPALGRSATEKKIY